METISLTIDDGVLMDAPVYVPHARCWAAVITADARDRRYGGIHRDFLAKSYGKGIYKLNGTKPCDAVEFGVTYRDNGQDVQMRWHGVVLSRSDVRLVLEKSEDAKAAIKRAAGLAGGADVFFQEDFDAEIDKLTKERESLMARWYELGRRIDEIKSRQSGTRPVGAVVDATQAAAEIVTDAKPGIQVVAGNLDGMRRVGFIPDSGGTAVVSRTIAPSQRLTAAKPKQPKQSKKQDNVVRLDPNKFNIKKG